MKQSFELEPKTYQYSSSDLKNNVQLAFLFLRQRGSISSVGNCLRNEKN